MSRSCPLPPAGAVNSHLSTVNSQLVIGKNDGNLLQFADLISHENDEIFLRFADLESRAYDQRS